MGRFLSCPLPFHSYKPQENSHQPHESDLHSDSSSSSSISSLSSQSSLPSLPSLYHTTTTAAAAHHHCLATLKAHSSYIFSLALAGKHLFSGASDGQIFSIDRIPSSHSHTISSGGGNNAVKSIAVSGDKLFSAHQDHKIRVWTIDSAKQKQHKPIAVLPTVADRCMRFLSPKSHVEVRRHKKSTWVHHVDAVSALALTKDGSRLYSVSWDRTFKVWRTSDFKCLESVENAHDDAINALVLPDDGFVYTGSADRRIKVWREKNDGGKRKCKHSLVSTLEKHRSAVNALALSGDGAVLYSGACDRSIVVWEKNGDRGDMTVVGALRGHTKAILCLAVVSDLLCSGSADGTVRVWRRGSEKSCYSCLVVFEGHRSPVKCLTAAVDGGRENGDGDSYLVYSGGLDCEIKVWKIRVNC